MNKRDALAMLTNPSKSTVKMIAEAGYDDGWNALHWAVSACIEAIPLLCKNAPPEIFSQVNKDGLTPVLLCVLKKEPAALSVMLNDGPWGKAAAASLAIGVMKKKKRSSSVEEGNIKF